MLLRSLAGWLARLLPSFFLSLAVAAVVDCVIGTRVLEPFAFPCRSHRLGVFFKKNFGAIFFWFFSLPPLTPCFWCPWFLGYPFSVCISSFCQLHKFHLFFFFLLLLLSFFFLRFHCFHCLSSILITCFAENFLFCLCVCMCSSVCSCSRFEEEEEEKCKSSVCREIEVSNFFPLWACQVFGFYLFLKLCCCCSLELWV